VFRINLKNGFDGIPLKSIAKGDLEDLDSKEEKAKKEKTAKDFDKVIEKIQTAP
jgi:molecular chaperone HtpG